MRAPRPRLALAALLLALAAPLLLAMLPAVGAAPALRAPGGWFDQTPALLRAHVAACSDVGVAGARMVGCKVRLGTQPEECVYLPEKAADPAKALEFLGLRKSKSSSGAGPGTPEFLQLESFPSGRNGAGSTCTEVLEPRKERSKVVGIRADGLVDVALGLSSLVDAEASDRRQGEEPGAARLGEADGGRGAGRRPAWVPGAPGRAGRRRRLGDGRRHGGRPGRPRGVLPRVRDAFACRTTCRGRGTRG
jgi:hypothetical protein